MPHYRRLPAIIAWALLAVQVIVLWTVPYYVTQDGPSHIYGATIVRELFLHHSRSVYTNLYTVQHTLAVPNWSATILLAIAASVAGPAHAEQIFVSLALIAGFLAWGYALESLAPDSGAPNSRQWTPIANFLLQTWFLSIGFYNFYLGMVLLPAVVGFHLRSIGRLTPLRVFVLSIGLIALFYTHLVPAVLAVMILLVVAFWRNVLMPAVSSSGGNRSLREFGMVLAAAVPAILLIMWFASAAAEPVQFVPQVALAWKTFPMNVFLTAGERFDDRALLMWPVLLYIAVGIILMTPKEWLSPRGGLAVSALLTFLIYLFVPNTGFGGEAVKMRFAWGVFLIGSLAACSASRLRIIRVPAALYVAVILLVNVLASQKPARAVSNAVADYLSATSQIEPKSSLVRLLYAAPSVPERYGYASLRSNPLFHLDALAAATRQCLDLSDYEAISKIFPALYRQKVDRGQQYGLWSFENPDPRTGETFAWLNRSFNVPIDYVLLVGDENSAEAARQGMPKMLAFLTANMQLVATSPNQFLRVYRRKP